MTDQKTRAGSRDDFLTQASPALVADAAARTIAGIVIPYGQPGRTSAGVLMTRAGAIRLPADVSRVKLFGSGHDRETPVAFALEARDTPDGLWMAFRVADTPAGDLALAEAVGRVRDAFSVELDDLVLSGDTITGAALSGVALVPVPAFPDARIHQVAASAAQPEVTAMSETVPEPLPVPDEEEETTTTAPDEPEAQAAAAPPGLTAGRPRTRSLRTLYQATVAMATNSLTPELSAALSDITHTANAWVQPTQYENQLWSGVAYTRKIVPLITSRPLTSYKVSGWRWVVKPAVAAYAGDKAPVPSNAATTEADETQAVRLAGAHDIDRKFRDFGDTAFFEAYYSAMAESYAKLSDQAAAAFLVAEASVSTATPADLLHALIQGCIEVDANTGASADFALANPADWATLFDVPAADVPAFLSLAPIPPSNIRPSGLVPVGTVIVGAKPAASFYERAGSPIRVETVSLANGGIDGGVFGYYATLMNDAGGVVKLALPSAPPLGLDA